MLCHEEREGGMRVRAGFLNNVKCEGAMKLARRKFLHLAAGAAALPAASRVATAQTYPTRPVQMGRSYIMRTVIIATSAAAALFSSPALTQQPNQGGASIPDFSGLWGHPSFGFEPLASGPTSVTNRSRMRGGAQAGRSSINQLVGDYTNPILKPEAAEVVKKHGELSLTGVGYPSPRNQCWPGGVPYIFWVNPGMLMLQRPDRITILYEYDHQVRHVRMNEPHPAHITSSWYGDSIGHYEGDTLVIDTVGIKVGPFAMVDAYGTPHTEALHVVERYRMLDYEAAKEGLERDAKENFRAGIAVPFIFDPNYRGKHLQLHFTVEDKGVFTMPWSATVTYQRPLTPLSEWPEYVCAENPHDYYNGRDAPVPHADEPDF
jgi:hypothetical protein